jgi:type II secretory pathway component PulF
MPVFSYTARDRSGNVAQGTVEAMDNSRAAALLREQGLWVTEIRNGAGERVAALRNSREDHLFKKMFRPVSLKDLALFYRQFHALLNAGMPLFQTLDTLGGGAQTPNTELRRVIHEMSQDLLQGKRLSETMARYPWLFDKMQVRMIEAGEQGGLLVEILERLSVYLEREYELRLEIKRKTLYPKLLLFAFLFIPPIPTLVLRGPQAYAAEVWGMIQFFVILGIPLFFAVRYLLTTRAGRDAYDTVKLAIPITGPLVRKIVAARFARTLAALYGAGVPIATAVTVAGDACGNSVLEGAAQRMGPAMERGVSISGAIAASGFFPPMFNGMVATGEQTGSLDQTLDKAADFYEEEAMHATVQLVVIMGVLLLLVMAIMIGI